MEKVSFKKILAKIEELEFYVRCANFEDVLKFQSGTSDARSIIKDLFKLEGKGLIKWNMNYTILEDGSKVKSYLEALEKDNVWHTKKVKNSEGEMEDKEYLKEVSIDGVFTDKLPDGKKEDYDFRLKMIFTKGRGIEYYLSFLDKDSGKTEKAFEVSGLNHLEERLTVLSKDRDFTDTIFDSWIHEFESPTNERKILDFVKTITSELKIPLDIRYNADIRRRAGYMNLQYQIFPKSVKSPNNTKPGPEGAEEAKKLLEFVNKTQVKDSIVSFFAGVMKAEVGKRHVKLIDLRSKGIRGEGIPVAFRLMIQFQK